jgi:Ca2+-binding EF-hand superfamily protein
MAEEIKAILDDETRLNEVTQAVFQQVDTNESGLIDKDELRNALLTVSREANLPIPDEEKITEVFKNLDVDKSGTIDVKEFRVLVIALLKSLV